MENDESAALVAAIREMGTDWWADSWPAEDVSDLLARAADMIAALKADAENGWQHFRDCMRDCDRERERADRAEAKATRVALTALTIDGEAMDMSGRIAATVAFVRGSGMTEKLQSKLLGLLLGEQGEGEAER
jgi:hypothetical protein